MILGEQVLGATMRILLLSLIASMTALYGCDSSTEGDDTLAGDEPIAEGENPGHKNICGELGLPSTYAEVEADYTALEQFALVKGEAATTLFASGDIQGLYDQFHEQLRHSVPLEALQDVYEVMLAVGPLGDRTDYRLMGIGRLIYYYGTYVWSDTRLKLQFGFDPSGAIRALTIGQMTDPLPDPNPAYISDVQFQMPLPCLTYVVWGGRDEMHNYHVAYASSAYAYDILVWQDGGTCAEPCTTNEDYHVFGLPILAPAAGVVVEAEDGFPDMPPGKMDTAALEGNHVTLEVAEGEYLLMAHMQNGSVAVKVGEHVDVGQLLGNVGNSGNTTEAHLHIQLQDVAPYDTETRSMPHQFYDVILSGVPTAQAMPLGSDFIAAAP